MVQQNIHGGDIYRNQVSLDFSVNINPFGMPPVSYTHLDVYKRQHRIRVVKMCSREESE